MRGEDSADCAAIFCCASKTLDSAAVPAIIADFVRKSRRFISNLFSSSVRRCVLRIPFASFCGNLFQISAFAECLQWILWKSVAAPPIANYRAHILPERPTQAFFGFDQEIGRASCRE